ALTEYAEKLECCIELHGATKQKLPACLDDAMRSALQRRREHVPPSLTVQDVFFRRVSLFETVLLGLVEYEQHAITQLATSVERTALIHQVGELLLTVVDTIRKRRLSSGAETEGETEWTTSDQVVKPLTAHIDLCAEYSSECGSDRRLRSQLLAHAVELVDFVLTEQSDSCNDSPLILKLMSLNEDARAIQLAERHRDFPALIRLSERLPKTTRDAQIAEWKIKFADDNFADLIYKWYLNSGQQTRLLSERTGDVDEFLAPHPEISWIRDINKNKFDKASQTLVSLALREQHSAAKKKTLLSLAKLCALASDNQDSAVIAETNEHLQVIEHQQRIPKHVITNAGLPEDPDAVKPLTPAQIVELSLADPDADEWTFARVLDLVLSMQTAVGHIDNSIQIDRIKLNIWLEALLKDDWAAIVKSEEVEELARNSCFFRTVAAVLKAEYDEDQTLTLLPDTEQLLGAANRLGQLCTNATFQYVIRAGEETYRRHLRTRAADNSMDVA
uniref:Nucleoporin Nup133/Nup155-like C-terminal domain-containing protein n=2 Tax=Plectus sambesii TaxID=2011161 RepID=A0A914X746_9BILA